MEIELESGDIFATAGRGLLGHLSATMILPRTDRYHFGLIWEKIGDDYVIIESTTKGIVFGWLSFYQGVDIKFYRVPCEATIRAAAPEAMIQYGRKGYDFILVIKIIFQCLGLWLEQLLMWGRIRRIHVSKLVWHKNDRFICTEVPDAGYDLAGHSILPDRIIPLPASYKWAEHFGLLNEIDVNFEGDISAHNISDCTIHMAVKDDGVSA